ncbi:hypothetical protein M3J09_008574 [Ascochyta lentis]
MIIRPWSATSENTCSFLKNRIVCKRALSTTWNIWEAELHLFLGLSVSCSCFDFRQSSALPTCLSWMGRYIGEVEDAPRVSPCTTTF